MDDNQGISAGDRVGFHVLGPGGYYTGKNRVGTVDSIENRIAVVKYRVNGRNRSIRKHVGMLYPRPVRR